MAQTCPSCGAETYDSARYCRKCGRQLTSSEFHEAPTRGFEQNRPVEMPAAAPPTFSEPRPYAEPPRYVPPGGAPVDAPLQRPPFTQYPHFVGTNPMQTGPIRRKKRNWLLIIGAIFFGLLLGGGVLLAIIINVIEESVANAPDIPKAGVPGGGTVGPFGVTDPNKLPESVQAWYYPDSTITHSISGGIGEMGGTVLIMSSEDAPEEVADFYRERIASEGQIQEIRNADTVVFHGEETNVVIKPLDENPDLTQVVVSLGLPSPPGVVVPKVPAVPPVPGAHPEILPEGAPPPPPPAPPAAPGKSK